MTFTPEQYGAAANGVADDTLAIQTAVDAAIAVNGTVLFNGLRYRITTGINCMKAGFKNFSIVLKGNGTFWDVEKTSIICDFKQGYGINIQNGKGCVIEGLHFTGKYRVPLSDIYSVPFADYNDTTISDSRNNPYCAIAVDYINNGTRSGSTGTIIRNCSFRDFTGAINYSPNGFTQNNELNVVEYCRGRNLKYFLSGGQAQEKLNVVRHVGLWDNIHTAFVFGPYGAGQPGHYIIDGVNIAGKCGRLISRFSQGFFPVFMTNVFAESLGSIGEWNTSRNDMLSNSTINLAYPQQAGFQPALTGNGLTIQQCDIRYYGMDVPVMFKGNVKLINNVQYRAPLRGTRYLPNDPDFNKGFRINNVRSIDYIEGATFTLNGVFKPNEIVVFMSNTDRLFLGCGQITATTLTTGTLSYIPRFIKTGKYIIGTYEQTTGTIPPVPND